MIIEGVYTAEDRARLLRAQDERANRARRCRNCRRLLPKGKRPQAIFCSHTCGSRWHAAKRDALAKEVRDARRLERTVKACVECGAALETRVRPGPVPKRCPRCYSRAWQRKQRCPCGKRVRSGGLCWSCGKRRRP